MLALLLKKPYKILFDTFINNRKDQVKDITKDFWCANSQQLLEIMQKPKEEQIELLEYLLDQFNNARYDDLAVITSNIINNIEMSNYSLLVLCSVFDRTLFFEKTVQYLDKIKERKKTDDSIITDLALNYNYGRIHYTAGKYTEAVSFLLKNFKENEQDVKTNYLLGKSFLELGNTKEAKKYFTINKNLDNKQDMEYINYSIRELEKLK